LTRFLDIPLPDEIPGYPCVSAPRFSNQLVEVASGDESANMLWENAKQVFRLPEAIRDHETYEALKEHWYVMGGTAYLFPFRDPLDFASVRLECANTEPTISRTDQLLGVGDGVETDFQLIKNYTRGGRTYVREIQLPMEDSVLIGLNGIAPDVAPGGPYAVTVTRQGGNVNIVPPPPMGVEVTAGYYFEVPVRFESDTQFEGIVFAYQGTKFADLVLIERLLC
jgi:uncharacterized protein (TIGR02217 family)